MGNLKTAIEKAYYSLVPAVKKSEPYPTESVREKKTVRKTFKPQKGFQENLLLTDQVNFVISGSGAGVGKTWVELYDAMRYTPIHGYFAVVFRRTYQQIFSSIIPQADKLYSGVRYNKFIKSPHPQWVFCNDAKKQKPRSHIQFSQMLYDSDKEKWQGSEISRGYFDEITHFSKSQVFYIFSRLRSQTSVTPRLLGTCNPDPDSFILDILDAGKYILPDGFADPSMSGKVQWMVHIDGEYLFSPLSEKQSLWDRTGIEPMTFTFVPGSIQDNKIMLESNPQYLAMLQGLPEYEKMMLLHGNWRAKMEGDIFKRHIFKKYWEDDLFTKIPIINKAIFVDTAQTQGAASDYTVFLAAGTTSDGRLIILDVLRGKFGPMETFRLAEAFYRKHETRNYNLINQKTGQMDTIRSAPLLGLFCEWANRGIDILKHLKNEKGLIVGPIKRQGRVPEGQRGNDKISRAIAVLPLLEKSGVWLPGDKTKWSGHDQWASGLNPKVDPGVGITVNNEISVVLRNGESVCTDPKKWVSVLMNECLSFRQGSSKKEVASQHDDITDCLIDAANYLLDKRGIGWIRSMIGDSMT